MLLQVFVQRVYYELEDKNAQCVFTLPSGYAYLWSAYNPQTLLRLDQPHSSSLPLLRSAGSARCLGMTD